MDPGIECSPGRLGVDVALTDHATERYLDVLAGAAEPVVKIEVAERGVEVVARHQADRPLAEPDAFGARGRARHDPSRLGNLVDAGGVLAGLAGLALLRRFRLGVLAVGGRGSSGH